MLTGPARHCFRTLAILAALAPATSLRADPTHSADSITVDDTAFSVLQGTDVQAALESADSELAAGPTPPNADVVYLRKDCTTGLTNCFSSMAALAGSEGTGAPVHPSPETNGSWLWDTRQPTPSSPVLVVVGPGSWTSFVCPDRTGGPPFGGVTLRGSGRETTSLHGTTAGFDASNCFSLDVNDMTISGQSQGVRWTGEGSAFWHDVDIRTDPTGALAAWKDGCSASDTLSEHSFFSSRIIADGAGAQASFGLQLTAFESSCSRSSFFGGELRAAGDPTVGFQRVVDLSNGAELRVAGTAIRGLGADRTPAFSGIWGVLASGNHATRTTRFELIGGIVSLFASHASGGTASVAGASLSGRVEFSAPASAWVVRAPDGASYRVATDAGGPATPVVASPFLWQSGTDEPESGLLSETGRDLFVETDCNGTTEECNCSEPGIDCSGDPVHPHLMVYDSSCSPTPWFDLVTRACRNTGP